MKKTLGIVLAFAIVGTIIYLRFAPSRRSETKSAEPALAQLKIDGELEIDLSQTKNRLQQTKGAFLAGNDQAKNTIEKLIKRQIENLYLQTVFREPSLPLPLDQLQISVGEKKYDANRERIVVPYSAEGYVVAPEGTLVESVPELKEIDSAYTKVFIVPADPENLFQRLGYACANQDEVPLGLVDDKNYGRYFDPFCAPGVEVCVHPKGLPLEPCLKVLSRENGVGTIKVSLVRIAYDEKIAAAWSGSKYNRSKGGADLIVDKDALGEYDIIYKNFEPNSCALVEQCVGGPGVRKLLRFRALTPNVGDKDLSFGDIKKLTDSNQFVYSACHKHYHFNGYGSFALEKDGKKVLPGGKLSFCLESTGRKINSPATEFTSLYQTCENQGISAGWEDEYFVGTECQWIDITDLKISGAEEKFKLAMEVNPKKLLCEGRVDSSKLVPAFDENGQRILGPNGKPLLKQACEVNPEFYKNNRAEAEVEIPASGGLVTQSCGQLEFGALRNCGWRLGETKSCSKGVAVIEKSNSDMTRVCHANMPCLWEDAIASTDSGTIQFTCSDDGKYLIMAAPYLSK